MTLEAITWAFKQPLKCTEKMVLLCLADHTNRSHECWPSLTALSHKSGTSRSSVTRSLKTLETAGLIKRKQRRLESGAHDRTIYIVAVDSPTMTLPLVPERASPSPTVTTPLVPQRDYPTINPKIEPKEEPNRSTSLETAYRLWNELAEEITTLPKVRIVPGPRHENLKARLKIGGLEGFARALEGVRRSPPHQNIGNWTGMNLGWMVENAKKYERMQNLADAPKSNGSFNGADTPNQSQKDNAAFSQALGMLQRNRGLL